MKYKSTILKTAICIITLSIIGTASIYALSNTKSGEVKL